MFRKSGDAESAPVAFMNGYADGQAARRSKQTLSAYLRVGIDDYAKGYRAGFFARSAPGLPTERPVRRHVANL